MDSIFGTDRFINEVVWKRTHSHGDAKRNFGSVFDAILIYGKSDKYDMDSDDDEIVIALIAQQVGGDKVNAEVHVVLGLLQ